MHVHPCPDRLRHSTVPSVILLPPSRQPAYRLAFGDRWDRHFGGHAKPGRQRRAFERVVQSSDNPVWREAVSDLDL